MYDNNFTYRNSILVDDGSTDKSWKEIERLAGIWFVRGIKFNVNYESRQRLHCGFQAAEVMFVITMDADLQIVPMKYQLFTIALPTEL